MGLNSKIQWTTGTWNPWHGCKKVSPGCKFCYMYRDKERRTPRDKSKITDFNDPKIVSRSKNGTFNAPMIWANNGKLKEGDRIFTCSWSDFFIEDADHWRDDAWKIIRDTPQFDYLILTKRAGRIEQCLPEDWGEGYPNVWLGVSVESEKELYRAEILSNTPAAVRFISAEPLLGPLSLVNEEFMNRIDWVIVGGESGNDTGEYLYRPCRMDWIKNIIADCFATNTLVFVKQLGTHISKREGYKDRHAGNNKEWPAALDWRQIPRRITKQSVEQMQEGELKFECISCGFPLAKAGITCRECLKSFE